MPIAPTIDANTDSESRNRVLLAAYPLFVEHGYKSVSMQQVADAVSINKATLYHHFRSKEAMFVAVVLMAMSTVRAQVSEIMSQGGAAAEQLTKIASQVFDDTQSDLGRLMTDVQEHLPVEERLALMRSNAHPWDLYEDIFRTAIQNGELPEVDPGLATSMFFGLIIGQTWARKIGKATYHLDANLAAALVQTLFAGLRAAPPTAVAGANPPAESPRSRQD